MAALTRARLVLSILLLTLFILLLAALGPPRSTLSEYTSLRPGRFSFQSKQAAENGASTGKGVNTPGDLDQVFNGTVGVGQKRSPAVDCGHVPPG